MRDALAKLAEGNRFNMIKIISTAFLLVMTAPVFAMWHGGGGHPSPGFGVGSGSCGDDRLRNLSERLQMLEQRVAFLERSFGQANMHPRVVIDCTLTTNFNETFAASGESELLVRAQVLKDCETHAKFKMCEESMIKCQGRDLY